MKRAAKIHKKFNKYQEQERTELNLSNNNHEVKPMKTTLTFAEVYELGKKKGYEVIRKPNAANPYRIGDLPFKYLSHVVEYLLLVGDNPNPPTEESKRKRKNAAEPKPGTPMEEIINECLAGMRRAPQWTPVIKWLESKGIKADDASINCPKPTFRDQSGTVVYEWVGGDTMTPKEKYRHMLQTMLNLTQAQP